MEGEKSTIENTPISKAMSELQERLNVLGSNNVLLFDKISNILRQDVKPEDAEKVPEDDTPSSLLEREIRARIRQVNTINKAVIEVTERVQL
jgi:hypothetical protein